MSAPGSTPERVAAEPGAIRPGTVVDPRPRRERLRGPLGLAGLGLLAAGSVVVLGLDQPGHFPPCPFRAMTGLDCPFCGGLRAARALLGGDPAAAWDRNALAVLLLPVAAVAWLVWLRRAWTGVSPAPTPARARRARILWLVALAVMLAWWIWRDLPAGAFWSSTLSG